MKITITLILVALSSTCFADPAVTAKDLKNAQETATKVFMGLGLSLPDQINVSDKLDKNCAAKDLYITCEITDKGSPDVGYTYGISVKFDHYGNKAAVNSITYLQH